MSSQPTQQDVNQYNQYRQQFADIFRTVLELEDEKKEH